MPRWLWEARRDVESETFWVTGGLGSGKTYGAAAWFIDRVFRNYRTHFSWAVAPTHGKIKDILIPAFHDVLRDIYGMEHGRDYDVLISHPARLTFKDFAHTVVMHSGQRPDLMIGSNISHYWITEAGTQRQEIFEKCQTRARDKRAEVVQGLMEGTPEGENWYCQFGNFDDYDAERKARRFIVWTEDNEHNLVPGYTEKLIRTYWPDWAKLESYLYGIFRPFTKSTAYWDFVDSRNVGLDFSPQPEIPIILTWDWNKYPLAWVALQRQAKFDRLGNMVSRFIALHESSGTTRGVMKACADFIAKFPPETFYKTPIHIYGDASGWAGSYLSDSCGFAEVRRHLSARYREVVIKAADSNPRVRDRLENVNKNCVYTSYICAAWCRRLIESHHKTQLKPGTWDILKPAEEDWSHYADAVGYALYALTANEDFEGDGPPAVPGMNAPL